MSDIERRWEAGIPHHPLSQELMAHMQRMDTAGEADLRTGGDGDNGETLMYLMDSFFETRRDMERVRVSRTALSRYRKLCPSASREDVLKAILDGKDLSSKQAREFLGSLTKDESVEYVLTLDETGVFVLKPAQYVPGVMSVVAFLRPLAGA